MKRFRNHLAALSLLGTFLLLSGCQIDGDDVFQEANQSGYLLAGQTGTRFVVADPVEGNSYVSGDPGQSHSWTYVLDSAADVSIGVSATYSSSPGYSFSDVAVGGRNGIEIAGTMVHDSVFRCEDWPIDSSTATITQYNALSGIQCTTSNHTYLHQDSLFNPQMFAEGDRIDASTTWGPSHGIFMRVSNSLQTSISPLGAYIYTTTTSSYHFWGGSVVHYVAFRWWSQDRYRYGYIRLRVGSGDANVQAIGYER